MMHNLQTSKVGIDFGWKVGKEETYVPCLTYCAIFLFCQDLLFDLGDCVRWEFMFPSNEKPTLDIPDMDEDALDFEDDEVRMMKTKNLSCMRYM